MLSSLPGTPLNLTPVALTPRAENEEDNNEVATTRSSQMMIRLKLLSENTAKRIEDMGLLDAARKARESVVDRWQREVEGSESFSLDSGVEQTCGPMSQNEFVELCGGGESIEIPRRTTYTQTVALLAGQLLRWQFYALTDISFSLRRRSMTVGGAVENDLIDSHHLSHRSGVAIVGHYVATEPCQLVACFDNTRALFRPASVLYSFNTANASAASANREAPVLPVPPSLRPPSLTLNEKKQPNKASTNFKQDVIPLIQLGNLRLAQQQNEHDDDDDDDDDDDHFALVSKSSSAFAPNKFAITAESVDDDHRNQSPPFKKEDNDNETIDVLDGVDIADVISL